ncbi:ankyrin repeat domain-containing protein [Aspergillus neoniger CBS 115656]|uniref:Ankyrin n=1 Tax=Aspergillus neoniger (strain CBS 115656) TaxID=1448310 RepID=A0A318YJI3_ASPNB|nr:ankyrin [Aspergillus neoniger CBS 115656]PYH34294.1 ankyrin [Aspergillus neoniger CBS 115656]
MDLPPSLDFSPAELVIRIGDFLDRKTLASFSRTSKRYAQLLTPQLLTLWLSCTNTGKHCYRRGFSKTQHWKSSHIVGYFTNFPSDVSRMYCCSTLLHRFAEGGNLELVKLMLSRGADINAKGRYDRTPLFIAAKRKHHQVVQALLEAGADTSAKDTYGDTPLKAATIFGGPDVLRCLLNSGQYTPEALLEAFEQGMKCYWPETCGEVCKEIGSALEKVGYEFNVTGTNGQLYLHSAARRGVSSLVQFFLDKGHDPCRLDEEGNTPLNVVCLDSIYHSAGEHPFMANREGLTPLHKAIQNSQIDFVGLYLNSGARVTFQSKNGIKCMEDILHGPRDIFELLVDRAPSLWPIYVLQSALHSYTTELKKGHGHLYTPKAIARILKLAKSSKTTINVSTRDASGATPFHNMCLATYSRAEVTGLIRSFIEAGADIDMPDDEGRTPLHNILGASYGIHERGIIQTMINLSKDLDKLTKDGSSYLHLAAKTKQLRAAQLLLSNMSKETVFAVDKFGRTALHYAAGSGNISMIQQVIATGIDINVKDQRGRTALTFIDSKDSEPRAAVLIETGADVNILDEEGRPPIHYANHHDETVELYLKVELLSTKAAMSATGESSQPGIG